MKKILMFVFASLALTQSYSQSVNLFTEGFDEADGSQSGTASGTPGGTWSVTDNPAGGSGSFSVVGGTFFLYLTEDEGVWESSVIDISSSGLVGINATMYQAGFNASSDYLRIYYKLNGGSEILIGEMEGETIFGIGTTESVSAVLSGNTIQIVIRGLHDSVLGAMSFDDVAMQTITTLYSTGTGGNWNSGTTWSAVSIGGAVCNCTPSIYTNVVVGGNDVVDITADAEVISVTVENTGQLRFTSASDLDIERGGLIDVQSGGSFIHNGNTTSQIDFDQVFSNSISVTGTFSAGDIDINAGASISISGSGSITVADDILMAGSSTISNTSTGTFSIGDRIHFESGASGSFSTTNTLSAGTVYFDNDNCTFTNSGTLTLSTGIAVGSNADDNNSFNNSGTLNLNGATSINGSNGDLNITNTGTINQSGAFSNTSTASVYTNAANATWNYSFSTGTAPPAALVCSATGNTFNYSASGAQSVAGETYYHLTLSGSGTKSTADNIDVDGNLLISGSAQLNVDSGNDHVVLAGNWTSTSDSSDPFVEGNGSGSEQVRFNGTTDQTISTVLSGGETFQRFVIDKTSGSVILNSTVNVRNTSAATSEFVLTQGVVRSSSTNLLILASGTSYTGGSSTSFVDGPLRKDGSDAFIFPVGDGSVYARIAISDPGASSFSFTAEYFYQSPSDVSVDATLDHVSELEYWSLVATGGTATVTLYWESGTQSQITDVSCCDLTVARFNGSDWIDAGRGSVTGSTTSGTIVSSSTSTFGNFTFGSNNGVNPLPVTLTYFDADLHEDYVLTSWETGQEINNDYFTVERSLDGESFISIGTVKGKGSTSEQSRYTLVDDSPQVGRSYYRLRQTDFDGKFTFSKIVAINNERSLSPYLRIYPNPTGGMPVSFQISGSEMQGEIAVPVRFYNQQGQKVYQFEINVTNEGESTKTIFLNDHLPPGLYIIKAGDNPRLTHKIVVN